MIKGYITRNKYTIKKNGEEVTKTCPARIWFDPCNIIAAEQVISSKLKVLKRRCRVYLREPAMEVVVEYSPEYMLKQKQQAESYTVVKGFNNGRK